MSIKTTSRPLYPVIRKLLLKQSQINETSRLLSGLGISIDFVDRLDLLEIALDIIGFPADNTVEFDFAVLRGNPPEEGGEGKRTDFDNMFCRDYLEDQFFVNEIGPDKMDEYIEFLYGKYDEYILEESENFVQQDETQTSDFVNRLAKAYAEMKVIEPVLDTIEREVLARNEDAAIEEVWWCDVWEEIKPALQQSVGMFCPHPEIATHQHWDNAGGYLQSIATNMK